jgi:hypothetical protein
LLDQLLIMHFATKTAGFGEDLLFKHWAHVPIISLGSYPELPKDFMEQSRIKNTRRYERFPCAQMVTIRPKSGKGAPADDSRAIVVDVSLGGLKMRTRSKLEPSTPYILTMGGSSAPVEFNGTVVHLENGGPEEETFVGFVFRPESHEERVAIANFVHGVFTQAWHAEAA